MDKNDILRIAKSLYLEQIISRQIFAKNFDINEQLDSSFGSFAKIAQRISSVFYGFKGSDQRDGYEYPQIVQKNKMQFKIYKLNANNTVSDQVYGNSQYNINQVAFILRKLYASIQKGGAINFKQTIKRLLKLWYDVVANKGSERKIDAIISQLEYIKQVLIGINDFIVEDIDLISKIRQLQDDILKLKDSTQPPTKNKNFSLIDQKMKSFFETSKIFFDKKSYIQSIKMAVNRLKSFVELYQQILQLANNQDNEENKDGMVEKILKVLQQCNTNKQIDSQMKKLNLKSYLDADYSFLTSQDDSIQAFIRFIKGIKQNSRIDFEDFEIATDYYSRVADMVLSDEAKKVLNELKTVVNTVKRQKSKDNNLTQHQKETIYTIDLSDELRNKIKNCSKQFV